MTIVKRMFVVGIVAACAAMIGSPASAQTEGVSNKPVNANCPIGKEPIVASVKTVEYKGKTIGFCCPGCGDKFMAWDDGQRDAFVLLAVAGKDPGGGLGEEVETPARTGDPYTLGTCPISGEELGSMGDSVVRVYDGREVRFCCEMCVGKFEGDTKASFKSVDEKIIADQLRYYPLETCIISDEALGGEDMGDTIEFVYNNRLVLLCCKMCKGDFKSDPEAYLTKLDKAVADAQRADYPLSTCVVAGGELKSMGDPVEIVVANRLVRFCCDGCKPDFDANPSQYLAAVDAAWNAKGKFMPAAGTGEKSGD